MCYCILYKYSNVNIRVTSLALNLTLQFPLFYNLVANLQIFQLYPTPNTSFTLLVSELHSIIPLGRTAGALREGQYKINIL